MTEPVQPTLLGQQRRQRRVPTEGVIRPGIRVLTSRAIQTEGKITLGDGREVSKGQLAEMIYEWGVSKALRFDEVQTYIEKRTGIKNALRPKNVPFFTTHAADWPNAEQARKFVELYGEEIEGQRRVRTFPVVFPVDDWTSVLPHQLESWKASQLAYRSQFEWEAESGIWRRLCMMPRQVPVDQRAKRALRVFEGRGLVAREDEFISRLCDPENCPQYQQDLCKLTGSIIAFIPGVSASLPARIPLTSYYGLDNAREQMEYLKHIRPISGFTQDGEAFWYVTKREDEISRIDRETGQPGRTKQWITHLSARIDLLEEIRTRETPQLEDMSKAERAAAGLQTGRTVREEIERDLDAEAGMEFDEETLQEPSIGTAHIEQEEAQAFEEAEREERRTAEEMQREWDEPTGPAY